MAETRRSRREARQQNEKKRVAVGAGAVLLLVLALCAYFFLSGEEKSVATQDEPVIGVLDLQQVAKAHPDYEQLVALEQEIGQLENSLALSELTLQLAAVTPDEGLFREAARQKEHLGAVERHAELVDELNAIAEKKREELKPQFEEERRQVSQPYQTEMLNLRIKIDNSDVLGLNAAQVDEMLARIDELQNQRSAALKQLSSEQEARFADIMAEEAAGPMAELAAAEEGYRQEEQESELAKQMEAQERNAEGLDEALSPIQQKISNARKTTLLETKKIQLEQLQNKIYSDIAGRAAKLAIMHNLTLILSSPADNLRGIDYQNFQTGNWAATLTPVLGVNTLDLTEELLQEMKTL